MAAPKSLQVVLTLRLREEESAERALAVALTEKQQALSALEAMEAALAQAVIERTGTGGELLHAGLLHLQESRIHALRHACADAGTALAQKSHACHEQQLLYLRVRRDREVVDTLLKHHAQREEAERRKREVKVSEDLFLGRLSYRARDLASESD